MSRSRIAAAAWLLLLILLLALPAAATEFTDVPRWQWAWRQIQGVTNAGVAAGYQDGTYQPGAVVTRDQMAVFISRAMEEGDSNVPPGPATATFGDVPNTGYGEDGTDPYWAYKYIEYCAAQGVVQGYEGGIYGPEGIVTRDQMAVFVARAKGWVAIGDDMATAPEVFPDVPAGFWAGTAIEACRDHGVVQGYGNGNYGPGDPVTRDQMAVFLCRAFGFPLPAPVYNITDYFPLADGNTWTYDSNAGVHTAAVAGTVDVSGTQCWQLASSHGMTVYLAAAPDGLRYGGMAKSGLSATFDPLLLVPNGLQVGDTGTETTHAFADGVDMGEVSLTYTFLGLDTVTVGAGTFADCMEMEVDIFAAAADLNTHSLVWLARGVGGVKQDSRPFDGSNWNELVVATVGGTDYPADRGHYSTSQYEPLQVATQRVYNTSAGPRMAEIVGVEMFDGAEAFRLDLGPTQGAWAEPSRCYLRTVDGASALVGQYDPASDALTTYSPPTALPATIQLGDHGTVSSEVLVNGVLAGTRSYSWTMVGIETVALPDGVFHDCLKLHTRTVEADGSVLERLEWYAPGIGLVRADARPVGGSQWRELTSAHVGGLAYPPAPGQTFDVTDYCNLTVGNEWDYLDSIAWNMHAASTAFLDGADWTIISGAGEGPAYYQHTSASGLSQWGYNIGGVAGSLYRYDPPLHTPNGLRVGDTSHDTVEVTRDGVDLGLSDFTCTLTGAEAVSTAAGLFPDCLRLEYQLRIPGCPTEAATVWMARGVGPVKQAYSSPGARGSFGPEGELRSAVIGGLSYPADPAHSYTPAEYFPLALDDAWMARTGGESLSAQRCVVDGAQDLSGLGIDNTAFRISRYGETGFEGADLWGLGPDGPVYYGFVNSDGTAFVANPMFILPRDILVGNASTYVSNLYEWTGGSWVAAGSVTGEWTLVAAGPIVTDAGAFDDCILLRLRIAGDGLDESIDYVWLAKGVGPVLSYRLDEPTWQGLMGATIGGVRLPDVPQPPAIVSMVLSESATAGLDLSSGTMTDDPSQFDVSYQTQTSPELQGVLASNAASGLSYVIGEGADPFLAYRDFATYLPWGSAIWGAEWSPELTVWSSYWNATGRMAVVATREGRYALVRVTTIGDGYLNLDVVYPYGDFAQ